MLNMSINDVEPEMIQHRGGIPPFLKAHQELERLSKDVRRASAVVCALDLVLHHHGCPETVMKSLESQVMEYLTVESESTFVKRAKYILCAPFAKYLKAEPPAVPDKPFEPKGEWKRWMKSRMCLNTQNTHLWYSFLQAKRAALPLSEGMVLETYKKHRQAMEIADPIDDFTHDLVMEQLKPVLDIVRRDATRLYHDTGISMESETRHTASTKASFESSRRDGGALGYLRDKSGVKRANPENLVINRSIPDLVRMSYHPVALVNGRWVRDYVHEEYEYSSELTVWQKFFESELPRQQEGRVSCTIQAVLEPLKVRVISKGEAVPYYVCKPLQRALHTAMRRMPCFRLIGKPLEEADLVGLVRSGAAGGSGPLEWFSIDYSAATDGLSARLSASIMKELIKEFPLELQNVFRRVLAPHYCEYPMEEVAPVNQVNGQLMGSILSFPVLCLANLGLYLALTRDDERNIHARMRGVLVNGDDMLYCARRSRWQEHVDLGKKVGLEMSVGKAYHHRTVANANSMCFHYEIGKVGVTPRHIPFLNSGLFFGQGKVQGGTDEDSTRSKSAVINELTRGSRASRACELLRHYISLHKTDLKKECESFIPGGTITRNLFLPESVGGMGQVAPEGFKFRITSDQRRLASTLYTASPTAWFADGSHYIKVNGRSSYEPAEEVSFDNSTRAPWLAPSLVSQRRFPRLGNDRMPKRYCRMGFVLTKTLRPSASCSLALRKSTPSETWWRDYRDYQIGQSFRTDELNDLVAYAEMEQAKGDTLQGRVITSLWNKTKLDASTSSIDPWLQDYWGEKGFTNPGYMIESVRLWNRRYGNLVGGSLQIPDGRLSKDDCWSYVRANNMV